MESKLLANLAEIQYDLLEQGYSGVCSQWFCFMIAGKGKPAIVTICHSLLPGEGIAGTPLDEFVLLFMCSSTKLPAVLAGVC